MPPKTCKRYVLVMQAPDGHRESMYMPHYGPLLSELIRLRDGHKWTVVKSITLREGVMVGQDFYPTAPDLAREEG